MINVFLTAADDLARSATGLTDGLSQNIPIIENTALCDDMIVSVLQVVLV